MKTCLILLLTAALSFFAWYHLTGGHSQHGSLTQAANEVRAQIQNLANNFHTNQTPDSETKPVEPQPIDQEEQKKDARVATEDRFANIPDEGENAPSQFEPSQRNNSAPAADTQQSPREEAIEILSGVVRLLDERH